MRSSKRLHRSDETTTSDTQSSVGSSISLDQLDSSNALFLDYLRDPDRVAGFYPHRPTLEAVERFARARAARFPARGDALAAVLADQQARWGGRSDPARRFATGAVAVVTGQQAGLFTGPLLAVLKALTAVKIARHLVSTGIDAVPVFWIASEDHDREEVSWAEIVDGEGRLKHLALRLEGAPESPVGWLRYPDRLEGIIESAFESLSSLEYAEEARAEARSAYRPGGSPVDAFAILMSRMFRSTDLVFVDPLDPAFRDLSGPVLQTAVSRSGEIARSVTRRTGQIVEAGYPAQVRVGDDFTGFFRFENGQRKPVRPGDPLRGDLSPSALVRPMVQDAVLPTVATVAGPAEVAYFAQAGAVYECLEMPMPPALARISATVVEPPARRALEKYPVTMNDVYVGEDSVRRAICSAQYDMDHFGRAGERIRHSLEELRPMLEEADPTLGAALDTALRKVTYQAGRLERRFISATTRREAVVDRAVRTLLNRLAPHGKPPERSLCPLGFVARYGMEVVPLLDRKLELDGSIHQVVEL